MALVVVVLGGALGVGLLVGGSLGGLARLRLRSAWLVVVGLVAQVGGTVVAAWTGPAHATYAAGLVVSALVTLAFCLLNLGQPGVPLVALGLLLNAAVVAANGAMPVSFEAAARAGVRVVPVADGTDPRHEVMDAHTPLGLLGDRIPVPLPVRPAVCSAGDVLVAAGLGQLVVTGMRRRRSRHA